MFKVREPLSKASWGRAGLQVCVWGPAALLELQGVLGVAV